MNRREAFQEVFISAFNDSKLWRNWFFRNVAVREDEISVALDGMGRPSGALLMQSYVFQFRGDEIQSEYMSCVATKPEARFKGVASKLIIDALGDAAARGSVICELIPAKPHLHYFYRRFGFAGVFYVDRQRYTALHRFTPCGTPVTPDYGLFSALERRYGCGPVHSAEQYALVMDDIQVDGGYAFAVREGDGSAIVFAAPSDDVVKVKCLFGDTSELADGALALLREAVGEKGIVVDMPPLSGNKAFLHPYGMLRIINAEALLTTLASAFPRLRYAIRLHDGIIGQNNGIFNIRDGRCSHPEAFGGHIDLDVSIETLAAILFSSGRVASVFELPGHRPYMSLMLD